jgi:hypothetical protein
MTLGHVWYFDNDKAHHIKHPDGFKAGYLHHMQDVWDHGI